jgi:hypothetical protein
MDALGQKIKPTILINFYKQQQQKRKTLGQGDLSRKGTLPYMEMWQVHSRTQGINQWFIPGPVFNSQHQKNKQHEN